MFRKVMIAACSGLALAAAAPAVAQQGFSPDQRTAIEAIIKDVLLKNPEIIQEALVELEKRQQQAQVDSQKQVLVTERAAIFESPNSPVAGNPQGDVTIVEFFDYNCGFCKRSLVDMQEIIKQDTKLKVVLKDFPVLGADSVEASRARALEVAREHGANIDQLRKDMESAQTRQIIEDTVVLGDRLGLTGTPAFVLADEIVFGAVGVEQIKTRIDAVRKCGRTNCG